MAAGHDIEEAARLTLDGSAARDGLAPHVRHQAGARRAAELRDRRVCRGHGFRDRAILPLGQGQPFGNRHNQNRTIKEGDQFVLLIEDNGPGVPDDTASKIFEPYFTTKSDGTGLGLAIVKKIVLQHRGTIALGRGPEGGAAFTISLPALGGRTLRVDS